MADLTIKFKGQPIVEMTESGTKTLKTAGKYCEDDISVEYAKPAGGGGGNFAETIVTDVMENHIVVSSWSPSVTAEEYIPVYFSYNGIVLPKIPNVLPYAYLTSDGAVIAGEHPWYYSSGKMYMSASGTNVKYTLSNEMWSETARYNDTGAFTVGGLPKWSSHDIPNGSATATEIYFEGSEPVPVE